MWCPLCAGQGVVSVVPVTAGALDFTRESFVACIACLTNTYAGEKK